MTVSRALYVNMRTVHNPQFLANYLLFSLLYNIMVMYRTTIIFPVRCVASIFGNKVDELPLISLDKKFLKTDPTVKTRPPT